MDAERPLLGTSGGFFAVDLSVGEGPRSLAERFAVEGFAVHLLNGKRMRTKSEAIQEFASVLRFPEYFGDNLDALEEMLSDLSWLPAGKGHVLLVSAPDEVLWGDDDELRKVIGLLLAVQEDWGDARPLSERLHPPLPFNVLLGAAMAPDLIGVRWRSQGAPVRSLT